LKHNQLLSQKVAKERA
jgi:hypothetical protein